MRCDSHVHIVGPSDRYPQLPSRTYHAEPAPLDALRRLAAARGVTRFVIVQASFYGRDNTLLLETLDALGGNGRGVAVIDPSAPLTDLGGLARRNVRGLRLNLHTVASVDAGQPMDKAFAALAAVAQPMRWHIEVIAPLEGLAGHSQVLANSPVPVVIDHYGLYGDETPESANGGCLIDLLRLPHVWVKLSAPYRVSPDPLATRPDQRWLDAIVDVAADRCVWGSDWPHTPPNDAQKGPALSVPYRALSYERLIDDFIAALPSAALAERILGGNPARLYEF